MDSNEGTRSRQEPTRQAYSREEITNMMNMWMVSKFGPLESYATEPAHRDSWLRDNGLLNRFIRDHFPPS